MGVIINGQERKSIAEQVEENSKYNPRLMSGDLTLYKKDIPCFIRVLVWDIVNSDTPIKIKAGNGTVLYQIKMSNLWVDYIITRWGDSGVKVYGLSTSGNFSSKTGSNGQYDKVLEIDRYGGQLVHMVIPMR